MTNPPPVGGALPALPSLGDGHSTEALRVLVVGGTVPSLVLTALLERSPHEPTLATGRWGVPISRGVPSIARPTYDLLADLRGVTGIGGAGTPTSRLTVNGVDAATTLSPVDGTAPPLRIGHRELARRLRRSVPADRRRDDALSHLREDGDGVEVTFEDGSRTRFDLVVGVDGPNSFVGTLTDSGYEAGTGLHEWTARIDRGPFDVADHHETWTGDVLLSATTFGDGLAVRIVADELPETGGLPRDGADELLRDLDGGLESALADGIPRPNAYRLLPTPAAGSTWRTGRVAFCGGAASPLGVLSGFHPSLAIEDCAVLVEKLLAAADPEGALIRYERDRRRRTADLETTVRGTPANWADPLVPAGDDPLAIAAAVRAVGFDGWFDSVRPPAGRF